MGFDTYHHTELTKQVESDESSHSKLKSVSCLGLLLPYSSSFCSCEFLRIQGRRLMKNQCFRQAPSFIRFSTPGAVAPWRTCVMLVTAPLPPRSFFFILQLPAGRRCYCNTRPPLQPLQPSILTHVFFTPMFASQIKFVKFCPEANTSSWNKSSVWK